MYRENMKIYEEMDKKKGKLKKDEEKIEDFVRSPKWLIQADSNSNINTSIRISKYPRFHPSKNYPCTNIV